MANDPERVYGDHDPGAQRAVSDEAAGAPPLAGPLGPRHRDVTAETRTPAAQEPMAQGFSPTRVIRHARRTTEKHRNVIRTGVECWVERR